jgi:hypothetical protein
MIRYHCILNYKLYRRSVVTERHKSFDMFFDVRKQVLCGSSRLRLEGLRFFEFVANDDSAFGAILVSARSNEGVLASGTLNALWSAY